MNLREQVVRGGAYLAGRQAIGTIIGAGGVLLLTRKLGPSAYGVYAAGFSIYEFLYSLSQFGITVYLIREQDQIGDETYHQAFSLLLSTGVIIGGGAIALMPLISRLVGISGFASIATVLFMMLPLSLISLPAMARLERALEYRKIAILELTGQTVYYSVALPLAFGGLGAWAPTAGILVKEIVVLVLVYRLSGYRPRIHWDRALIRRMLTYGLGFSGSIWILRIRSLVNPLIVGPNLGAEAVGYISLAERLVDYLGFVKNIAWRISISALARLQHDRARLLQAVSEGTALQVVALGPLLVAFSWLAPWLLPLFFGDRWLPVMHVYPFIAAVFLCDALFNLQSSALYVLRYNWKVAQFNMVQVFLFVGAAIILVPYLGITGYGWAGILATPSYAVIHRHLWQNVGRASYFKAALWFLALALALFAHTFGWWICLFLIVPLIWRNTLSEMLTAARRLCNQVRSI